MVRSVREKTVRASCDPGGRLAARARALRELIGAALRAAAEALHLLGSCLDAPPRGSKATRSSEATRARPGTGGARGPRGISAYPAARDSPGHSPRVAARSACALPLAREQPDAHLLIVHPRQPPGQKDQPALRPCDFAVTATQDHPAYIPRELNRSPPGSLASELVQGVSDCGVEPAAAVSLIFDDLELAGRPIPGQLPGSSGTAGVVATVDEYAGDAVQRRCIVGGAGCPLGRRRVASNA